MARKTKRIIGKPGNKQSIMDLLREMEGKLNKIKPKLRIKRWFIASGDKKSIDVIQDCLGKVLGEISKLYHDLHHDVPFSTDK
jgi:hypothetical protein